MYCKTIHYVQYLPKLDLYPRDSVDILKDHSMETDDLQLGSPLTSQEVIATNVLKNLRNR